VPYARNARTHSPQQIAQIAASMAKFKQTQHVIVDEDGGVIAGHGRILAAQQLGWSRIKVAIASGWSETDKQAYRIIDNQLGLNSTWDDALLKLELTDLQVSGFDLQLLGFDDLKLVQFLAGNGSVNETEPLTTEEANKSLAERFGVPPFSVLNAREGWWQQRKHAWVALGIQSELGRDKGLAYDLPERWERGAKPARVKN